MSRKRIKSQRNRFRDQTQEADDPEIVIQNRLIERGFDLSEVRDRIAEEYASTFSCRPPASMKTWLGVGVNALIFSKAMELKNAGVIRGPLIKKNLDTVLEGIAPRLTPTWFNDYSFDEN